MKMQRLALTLTIFNLAILAVLLLQPRSASAQLNSPLVRTQRLEIVDENDIVRAMIIVEKDPDTVLLRMADPKGLVRVKLGADEDGSGLLLANDSQQPGVQMLARSSVTSLKLTGPDGRVWTAAP
jgi:hypothetical protein